MFNHFNVIVIVILLITNLYTCQCHSNVHYELLPTITDMKINKSNQFNRQSWLIRHLRRHLSESDKQESASDSKDGEANNESIRTATGGLINNILILFSILAFLGNAIFMVNVFWLSR